MLKFTAFKTQKPRGFNYKPRYYDPDQEAREQRRRELQAQRGVFTEEAGAKKSANEYRPGDLIASKRQSRISSTSQQARNSSKIRFLSLLVIVAMLGYWLFFM